MPINGRKLLPCAASASCSDFLRRLTFRLTIKAEETKAFMAGRGISADDLAAGKTRSGNGQARNA